MGVKVIYKLRLQQIGSDHGVSQVTGQEKLKNG